jgi:hypothetical protein
MDAVDAKCLQPASLKKMWTSKSLHEDIELSAAGIETL